MTDWTEEAAYDEQIAPLMTKIIEICKAHEIPMVASFQYANEGGEPLFVTTALPFSRQHERMLRLNRAVQPERPVALAITETTKPDGSKNISIRNVT